MTVPRPLDRLRALCLALPEATERVSHGEPAWFVRRTPQFVTFADRHHDARVAFWAAAPPGAQQDWIGRDPGRFFVPPYVGGRGWVGVYLDVALDGPLAERHWVDVEDIVEHAYRSVAPAKLIALLDRTVD
ncbi:MmcQ/YjbR family DNA-binding protein [Rhodococcus spelaei]|uniref:MmcQ/YjbR family DNA-binding protein n=1 Tax=Rhodococcus spelaei TaxID=2546320 RepID=A0A541BPB5_9NOCA|nr:MmcQ/YjbR family DNA-binding protein [Rhodococcus spelaei]TQF74140.1 MmcQ/YjbR family DNA-binding protein [Rhodococcus spelaei]